MELEEYELVLGVGFRLLKRSLSDVLLRFTLIDLACSEKTPSACFSVPFEPLFTVSSGDAFRIGRCQAMGQSNDGYSHVRDSRIRSC